MSIIEPGFKEEITDLFNPKAIPQIKVGTVFKFNYEGTITAIKVTRKSKGRLWGVHVSLQPGKEAMTHYGHNIDVTSNPVWCSDCEMPVSEEAKKETPEGASKPEQQGDNTTDAETLQDESDLVR